MSALAVTRDDVGGWMERQASPARPASRVRTSADGHRAVVPASDWHPAIVAALAAIARECTAPGWDGDGSLPVTDDVIGNVVRVVSALNAILPAGIPPPDLVPEGDGEISIDWNVDRGRVFSISIGAGDIITFAGQFGDEGAEHGWRRLDRTNLFTLKVSVHNLAALIAKLYR